MIFRVGIAILHSSQEYLLSQDMEGMLKVIIFLLLLPPFG